MLHRTHHRDNLWRVTERGVIAYLSHNVLSFCGEDIDALRMHYGGGKGTCNLGLFL